MSRLPLRPALDRELEGLRVDEALARRIRRAAREKEEAPVKKRFKMSLSLALVLLAVLLLASAALALSDAWGVMDFFGGAALDGAEERIQRGLGSAQDQRMRMEIREALFDGKGVQMVIECSPRDQGQWLYSDWADYTPEEMARPGKIELAGFPDIFLEQPVLDGFSDVRREGESLVYYLMSWNEETTDQIAPTVSFEGLSVETRLSAGQGKRMKLTPGPQPEGLEILEAEIFSTPLANYLTVRYRAQHAPGQTGIQPYEIDPALTYYGTGGGRLFHRVSDCSGMEGAQLLDPAQLEGKSPCPLCVGESGSGANPGLRWRMELLHPDGRPIDCYNSITRVREQEGKPVYVQTLLCQAGDLPEELTLQAGNEHLIFEIPCRLEAAQGE